MWRGTRACAGSASSVFGVSVVASSMHDHGMSNLGMRWPGADMMHSVYEKRRSASGTSKDAIFVSIAFSWLCLMAEDLQGGGDNL